jgi:hypothetical protein
MKRTSILFIIILLLLPILVFVQMGGTLVISNLIQILFVVLIISLIGVFSAIAYLINGRKITFYVAVVIATILFGLGVVFKYFLFLPSFIILSFISCKKIEEKKTHFFWYYALNTSLLLTLSIFYRVISENYGFNIPSFIFYLDYAFYALISFLYAKTLLQPKHNVAQTKIYFNINVICLMTYLSILTFYAITDGGDVVVFFKEMRVNMESYFLSLSIFLIISNLTAFITIKNYR